MRCHKHTDKSKFEYDYIFSCLKFFEGFLGELSSKKVPLSASPTNQNLNYQMFSVLLSFVHKLVYALFISRKKSNRIPPLVFGVMEV